MAMTGRSSTGSTLRLGIIGCNPYLSTKHFFNGHGGRCQVPVMAQTRKQVVSAVVRGEDKTTSTQEVHISLHRRPSHTSPPTNPNVGSDTRACTATDDDADANTDAHTALDINTNAQGNTDILEIWGTLWLLAYSDPNTA
ncbi:hypothetical protein PVK06_024447 [Gossypium arboreum]|uniref:Uncharacterized protein n=1 Tax=Gossypium arboreum TaxID=29729 RepID=A0ABR0PDZ2_GOSAR|nr:hypothetical protein PVK06_024447 [Gossypium arboreum]